MPVCLALPLLKHLLGVPVTFSDLEFVDAQAYHNCCWVRDAQDPDVVDYIVECWKEAADEDLEEIVSAYCDNLAAFRGLLAKRGA